MSAEALTGTVPALPEVVFFWLGNSIVPELSQDRDLQEAKTALTDPMLGIDEAAGS